MKARVDFAKLDSLINSIDGDFKKVAAELESVAKTLNVITPRLTVLMTKQIELGLVLAAAGGQMNKNPTDYNTNLQMIDQANAAYNLFADFYEAEGTCPEKILTRPKFPALPTLITTLHEAIVPKINSCLTIPGFNENLHRHLTKIFMDKFASLNETHQELVSYEQRIFGMKQDIVKAMSKFENGVEQLLQYKQANQNKATKIKLAPTKKANISPAAAPMVPQQEEFTLPTYDSAAMRKAIYAAIDQPQAAAAPKPAAVATAKPAAPAKAAPPAKAVPAKSIFKAAAPAKAAPVKAVQVAPALIRVSGRVK